MEHAKKMILVEPRVFASMQRTEEPSWDGTTKNLKEKDYSMKDILNDDDDDDDDQHMQDKANAYHQALWRFLKRLEQYKDRPLGRVQISQDVASSSSKEPPAGGEAESEETDPVVRDVVGSVPKSLRDKASQLLQRLKRNPDVDWNERGEFKYRGHLLKNSNLTDLVNDVLRQRKRRSEPLGWETFAQVLQNLNIPQDLIANQSIWRYIRKRDLLSTPMPSIKKPKPIEEESFQTPSNVTPIKWAAQSERKKKQREKKQKAIKWAVLDGDVPSTL